MTFSRLFSTCTLASAAVLAACQGNLGSGGLGIPQPPQYGQQAPGGLTTTTTTTTSRQRALEGAVTLSPQLSEIPLPNVDGFSVAVELGTPPPSPSPSALASGSPAAKRSVSRGALSPDAAEAATLTPASAPSAAPSPAPSASVGAAASVAPSGSASAAPHPSGSPNAAAKIATKTIAYPDDAPAAPTPTASGAAATFAKRTAIVRGYLEAGSPLSLYGLGAIRFTIPAQEAQSGRGFTVALFEAARKHHETLLASDSAATVANNIVTAGGTTPIALKKDTGYLLMLYGDELPSTPAPGYPSPGINPFVTPGPGGVPQGPSMQTPLPGQPQITPLPGQPQYPPTPTPF